MDIYGAFQFCTLGLLSAPITVKLSRTYFSDAARRVLFAWHSLIFAGRHISVRIYEKLLKIFCRLVMFDCPILS